MKDVASSLGVSVVAISKALRDAPDIGAELKERVRKRCVELDFHPNLLARGLATQRTFSVGLMIPNLSHSFFADIAQGIAGQLHARGYTLALANSEGDPALERKELEGMLARQVDGIILASVQPPNNMSLFRRIRDARIPVVLVDRYFPKSNLHFVGADDQAIGRMGTAHLIECGRRRIAHIASSKISTGFGRLRGYLAAMSEAGLNVPVGFVAETDSGADGYAAMRQLLRLRPHPDGVFCFNDPAAVGAMQAILENGLAIPGDIALVGAGNMRYSDMLRVPLTTIDLNCSAIGEQAAACLFELMDAGNAVRPQRCLMPLRMVVRESSGLRKSKKP